jgi:superfamily II DNA/RNA helicase
VEDLIKLSLKRPIRIKIDGGPSTLAPRLVQEFVKVRDVESTDAVVLSLVCRSFGKKTIVFCEKKVDAHRLAALMQLQTPPLRVSELHGDLQQAQRYAALQNFRDGMSDILVATDVAARGLDIPGVLTVISGERRSAVQCYDP